MGAIVSTFLDDFGMITLSFTEVELLLVSSVQLGLAAQLVTVLLFIFDVTSERRVCLGNTSSYSLH